MGWVVGEETVSSGRHGTDSKVGLPRPDAGLDMGVREKSRKSGSLQGFWLHGWEECSCHLLRWVVGPPGMSSCGECRRSWEGHPGRDHREACSDFVGVTFQVPIRWLDSVPRGHLPAPAAAPHHGQSAAGPPLPGTSPAHSSLHGLRLLAPSVLTTAQEVGRRAQQ